MIRSMSFSDHLKPDQDLDAEIWFHFLEHCKTVVKVCSHLAAIVCNLIYMYALLGLLTMSYGGGGY